MGIHRPFQSPPPPAAPPPPPPPPAHPVNSSAKSPASPLKQLSAQSPPDPRSRQRASPKKKHSTNYIKTRSADPAVISGILSSLETITPPIDLDRPAHFFESASGEVRPYPSATNVADAPIVPRLTDCAPLIPSAGLSNEYVREVLPSRGPGLNVDGRVAYTGEEYRDNNIYDSYGDDDEDDRDEDVAAPPVVPTSRPPSGLSHYTAPRPPTFTNTSAAHHRRRPPSVTSHASSGSIKPDRDPRSNNSNSKKLSAESWVKPSTKTDRSTSSGQALRSQPRELRRINSQEALRPAAQGNEDVGSQSGNGAGGSNNSDIAAMSGMSKAEEIIARTPPVKASSKGRLYLGDTTLDERQLALESPGSYITYPEIVESPRMRPTAPASPPDDILSTPSSSKRDSPAKASPIIDSIPLRTSSLRQTSRSPAPKKKKDRKWRRTPTEEKAGKVEKSEKLAWSGSRKTPIPESTWADLGDDDDTVKRIRQLREQRKERLRESLAFIPPEEDVSYFSTTAEGLQHAGNGIDEQLVADKRLLSSDGDPTNGHPQRYPGGVKSLSAAPTIENSRPGSSRGNMNGTFVATEKSAYRPATAATQASGFDPSLALDYSYSEAMDALQDVMGNPKTNVSGIVPPTRDSIDTKESILLSNGPEMRSAPNSPHRRSSSKKGARRPVQDRWSTHPDLPLEFDKKSKSRRKSMSDARLRTLEEELELHRRDSIDDAVLEYLRAPRLSQKVAHPSTGRTISFSEVGDPDGAAVFVCLGMGLTRYVTAFFDELAVTLRLRLITVERPGVGASSPYPSSDRSGPLSWPDDVLAVCQRLGIGKFSLLAHSAGAIYALATALILPHLIKGKVQLLAPWIPPSQLEMISHPTASAPPAGALPRSQRILRVLPTPFLKAANSSFMTATSASLKPVNKRNTKSASSKDRSASPTRRRGTNGAEQRPHHQQRDSMMMTMDQFMPNPNVMESLLKMPVNEDDPLSTSPSKTGLDLSATATPTDPNFAFAANALNAAEHEERERKVEYSYRLTQRTWELATRDSNPATDLLVCLERHREVGFRYTDVTREVVITHGSDDKRVPVANVRWLADQMNRKAAVMASASVDGNGIPIKRPSSRERWEENPMSSKAGCEVRVLEGEGHGLMASPIIMGDVLTDIAGAWIGSAGDV